MEVILLLMVALILYPSSVFLNRGNTSMFLLITVYSYSLEKKTGNHEDIMVTVRYGFQNEVGEKYGVSFS